MTEKSQGQLIPPKAILIDVGGVVVANQWEVVARRLSPRLGLPVTQILDRLRRNSKQLDLGQIDLKQLYASVTKGGVGSIPFRWFHKLVLDSSLMPYRRNLRLLQKIKSELGIRMVAITNVGPEIAAVLEHKLHLSELFEVTVRSFEVGAAKPDRRIFLEAVRRSGFACPEVLYVDDSARNVLAARKLGIRSIQLASPARLGQSLKAFLPLRSATAKTRS